MGSSSGEHMKIDADNATECSETTVEIKIKTLDSQTFTMRVDKCVPVPELKQQIANVTGVLSEQQRLICRGKVLKDDQLLSAYHVEDGHTLHMVVRQPVTILPEQPANQADPLSSGGQVPDIRASPSMVVGTFNVSEQGDGFPDLNRIISAVLSSLGGARAGSSGEAIDLNQPPLERIISTPGLSDARNSSRSSDHTVPTDPSQPPVIPDSMTTLQQYLLHLRREFSTIAGGPSFPGSDGEAAAIEPRRLLTPESLAGVMLSARSLLIEQVNLCLLEIGGLLETHSDVTETSERSRIQSDALRCGGLIQNLGATLLELGRATMTLRMGQTPADAFLNAGPPVFISSTGPNPIMVQPLPFQPGLGSVPVGNVQHGSGFVPRNIDIRIRTGSLFSRRDSAGSQPQGQTSSNSGQQDAAPAPNRELRAVPLRTVVATVPASMARTSDSPVGILYPVLARVQHGNSNASNIPNVEQPIPVTAPAGNEHFVSPSQGMASQIRDGLQQLLSSMFPGAHVVHDDPLPTHTTEPASAPDVSDEGVTLSNILRHIMPMVSQNTAPDPPAPDADDEPQVDDNSGQDSSRRRRRGSQSQPTSKRRRTE